MRKKILGLLLSLNFFVFAFDWPQAETKSDSFCSYFGQLRGGTISSSLIFKDSADILAAEEGRVSIVITDHTDDFGWFDSSLGNTVIINHNDGFSTVYSNLEDKSIPSKFKSSNYVKSGELLGVSGNSGWQEVESCLEFKIFDTKNDSVVNPRILMPRIGKELPLSMGQITLVDKDGVEHKLLTERKLPAGIYSVYKTRQDVTVPFKIRIFVNGVTVENVSFDILKEIDGKLCVVGNSNYDVKQIYADKNKLLVGTVQLNKGSNTLGVEIFDILNISSTISYKLDIY